MFSSAAFLCFFFVCLFFSFFQKIFLFSSSQNFSSIENKQKTNTRIKFQQKHHQHHHHHHGGVEQRARLDGGDDCNCRLDALFIIIIFFFSFSLSSSSSSAFASNNNDEDGGDGYAPRTNTMKEEEKERRTRTNTVSSQSHHQQHPPREKDTFDAHHHAQFKSINEEAKKCSLIVASFYATKPGGFDRKKGERCNGCHEPPMFITMESARMTNGPGTCVALITDEETEIDMSKPGMDKVQLHRFEGILDRTKIGTGALMLERMKLYNAFIKRARDNDWNADLLMVDTDIVFVGDVSDLFQTRNFDYGVTEITKRTRFKAACSLCRKESTSARPNLATTRWIYGSQT